MLELVGLEERASKDHPIRTITIIADEVLNRLSSEFNQMYSKMGRGSLAQERLLKASLLRGPPRVGGVTRLVVEHC